MDDMFDKLRDNSNFVEESFAAPEWLKSTGNEKYYTAF